MNWDEDDLKSRSLVVRGFHLPYNPDLIKRAKWLRNNITEAEKILWYHFLQKFKYRVLRPRPIDNFIVDFYCPKARVVIEIDGDDHSKKVKMEYDEERTSILGGYGLTVFRIKNEEVLNKFSRVQKRLEKLLAPLIKGGAERRGDLN